MRRWAWAALAALLVLAMGWLWRMALDNGTGWVPPRAADASAAPPARAINSQ